MRYRLVIVAASLLALLLLVEGLISCRAEDEVSLSGRHDTIAVTIGGGGVYLDYFGFPKVGGPGIRFHRRHLSDPQSHAAILRNDSCLGFGYVSSVKNSAYLYLLIRIPIWFSLLLLAAICAITIRRYRSTCYQSWIARRCVRCGYDVRVTPDRCPECGLLVEDIPPGWVATLRSMMAMSRQV